MTPDSARPLVLMVDDDQDTRDMYALYLDFAGMDVITAASVEAALALALERQPDIVITDLLLGGRANGAELCRRMHDDPRTARIPAVLMTGSSRKADAEAALAAGCAEVRLKPYLPDALATDILHIIKRPRSERLAG